MTIALCLSAPGDAAVHACLAARLGRLMAANGVLFVWAMLATFLGIGCVNTDPVLDWDAITNMP